LREVLTKLNLYREAKGFYSVIIRSLPSYEDVGRLGVTEEWHKILCNNLEMDLSQNAIDYFIIPSPSIHQSHTQSHYIGKSLLRDPYLNNIREVLVGTYQVDARIQNTLLSEDCVFNPISEEGMELILDLLVIYQKNLLPTDELKTILAYNGFRCHEKYAQVFHPVYRKLSFIE
jgi:hypothetical protein